MAGGIEVPIDGDISPLLATFAELPGRTQDEMRAVGKIIQDEATKGQIYKGFLAIEGVSEKSAKRATAAVLKEMQSAAKEAEKTTAAAAKAAETATNDVKKGATVLLGGVVGDIEDVVGALGAMGPAAVAASGAVAVMAAGFAALWAEYKVVGMLYEFADATGKLKDEQKALSVAIDSTKQAIGDRFVPVFEGAIIGVTAGVLAIRDFTLRALDAASATLTWYKTLPSFAKALIGNVAPALQQADAIDKLSEGLRSGTIDAGGYVAQARSLVGGLAAVETVAKRTTAAVHETTAAKNEAANAAKAAADAAKAEFDGAAAWIKQQEALNRQEEQRVKNIQEAEQAGRDAYEAALAQERERAAAEEERAAARLQQIAAEKAAQADYWNATATAGISAAATLAQAVSDGAAEGSKAQKDAAMVAFRINQAQSLASIGMNTAEAASKAVALFGPPPSPLGIAGIVAATAIGLTQAAAVAAQPPPSFHTGGVIASNPLSPDETMIKARKGEEIRTRQEQGVGVGAGVTVQMVYQHRVFDTFIADNMKQTSSPLRREITSRSGRLLGHRERAR